MSSSENATSAGALEGTSTAAPTPESSTSAGDQALCPPHNATAAAVFAGGSDAGDPCVPPARLPAGYSALRVSVHCAVVVIGILSFVLCSLFLRALRKSRGKVASRWCIASVIAMDIVLGVTRVSAAVIFFLRYAFRLHGDLLECSISVSQVIINYWTGLPSLLSLLALALDQFLAIAFPLMTHVKSKDRLKKGVFTLVIWGPSVIFSLTAVTLWLATEEWTCPGLRTTLVSFASSIGTIGMSCLSLNMVVYVALFLKVVLHTYFNAFRRKNREEVPTKQRNLMFVFFAIFVANSVFWLPPWLYLAIRKPCPKGDSDCVEGFRDVFYILLAFYQLNTIFDPLFLAWRFPVLWRQMFPACGGCKKQTRETSRVQTGLSSVGFDSNTEGPTFSDANEHGEASVYAHDE